MIITLCGSTRFKPLFKLWNKVLSLSGHAVFSLGVYDWYSEEQKEILDKVHKDKILHSDAIFVINFLSYIGESTLSEIKFAKEHSKEIYFLESWGKGCGIGSNHTDEYQDAARYYTDVMDKHRILDGSPIDTVDRTKYPTDLLPDTGPYRSQLVNEIESTKNKLIKEAANKWIPFE